MSSSVAVFGGSCPTSYGRADIAPDWHCQTSSLFPCAVALCAYTGMLSCPRTSLFACRRSWSLSSPGITSLCFPGPWTSSCSPGPLPWTSSSSPGILPWLLGDSPCPPWATGLFIFVTLFVVVVLPWPRLPLLPKPWALDLLGQWALLFSRLFEALIRGRLWSSFVLIRWPPSAFWPGPPPWLLGNSPWPLHIPLPLSPPTRKSQGARVTCNYAYTQCDDKGMPGVRGLLPALSPPSFSCFYSSTFPAPLLPRCIPPSLREQGGRKREGAGGQCSCPSPDVLAGSCWAPHLLHGGAGSWEVIPVIGKRQGFTIIVWGKVHCLPVRSTSNTSVSQEGSIGPLTCPNSSNSSTSTSRALLSLSPACPRKRLPGTAACPLRDARRGVGRGGGRGGGGGGRG